MYARLMIQHGFARNLPWEIHSHAAGPNGPEVVLSLKDNEKTHGMPTNNSSRRSSSRSNNVAELE